MNTHIENKNPVLLVSSRNKDTLNNLEVLLQTAENQYTSSTEDIEKAEVEVVEEYKQSIKHVFDKYAEKLTPPNGQTKQTLSELTIELERTIEDGETLLELPYVDIENADKAYDEEINTAFNEAFCKTNEQIIERSKQYLASKNGSIEDLKEFQKAKEVTKNRKKDYNRAKNKLRRNIGDAMDEQIVNFYQEAEITVRKYNIQRKNADLMSKSPLTIPIRLNKNDKENIVEVTYPLFLENENSLAEKIDKNIRGTEQANGTNGSFTSVEVQDTNQDELQENLEKRLSQEQAFKDANVRFKFCLTQTKSTTAICESELVEKKRLQH